MSQRGFAILSGAFPLALVHTAKRSIIHLMFSRKAIISYLVGVLAIVAVKLVVNYIRHPTKSNRQWCEETYAGMENLIQGCMDQR